ncbi:MAG: S-layer homology domain-containing protein [Candidatus Heteroscillospira sp.]|jgi:hypothetical protein
MKKIILLALALSLSLSLCLPAAASGVQFPDVTDEQMQLDVDVLRMMGVVEGDGTGYFRPQDKLTRAQFCKMAVIVLDRGDEEYIYRNRTIFPDVRSNHWARGYINLAVSAEQKIIIGNGDGTFRPDDQITYAQAVTMLMRMLGYSDADAGMLWPQGYMELAADCGLTKGINLANGDAINRGQAARIFCNLLAADKKEGGEYVSGLGTVSRDTVVMSDNATADDGKTGAIATSAGNYLPRSGTVPASFIGRRGMLVTDDKGYAVTFIPDSGKTLSIVAASAQAGWIRDNGGKTYNIGANIPAYTTEEESTYDKLWMNISAGTRVNLYFTEAGKIDGVFINDGKAEEAAVAFTGGGVGQFASILGGARDYEVYKNGIKASASDIKQYDVATYDKGAGILYVSDTRLTGIYENAYPNPEYPTSITVMGKQFNVLSCAVDSLRKFDVGDSVTLLLTNDLQVAGAVSSSSARTNAVGMVTECSTTSAKVELFIGITVSGEVRMSDDRAESMMGQLVTVASSGKGKISLSPLGGSSVSGSFNVEKMTLDGKAVSPALKIFEKVGSSAMREVDPEDIAVSNIPSSKIVYASKDYAGRAAIIVLNDVTGDLYTYGIADVERRMTSSGGGLEAWNNVVKVTNGAGSTPELICGGNISDGDFVGVVPALDGERTAGIKELSRVDRVSRSDFRTVDDRTTVTTSKGTFVVSEDVACYNDATDTWFSSLDEARGFSDNLTLYYDKDPDDGGKIRIVVAK